MPLTTLTIIPITHITLGGVRAEPGAQGAWRRLRAHHWEMSMEIPGLGGLEPAGQPIYGHEHGSDHPQSDSNSIPEGKVVGWIFVDVMML